MASVSSRSGHVLIDCLEPGAVTRMEDAKRVGSARHASSADGQARFDSSPPEGITPAASCSLNARRRSSAGSGIGEVERRLLAHALLDAGGAEELEGAHVEERRTRQRRGAPASLDNAKSSFHSGWGPFSVGASNRLMPELSSTPPSTA